MKYILMDEDNDYCRALMDYYKKHYKGEILFSVNALYDEECVVISKQRVEGKFIKLAEVNDLNQKMIHQYQRADAFFEMLQKFTWAEQNNLTEVFMFVNGHGGAGATTLALNLAKNISEEKSTFFLSLDAIQSSAIELKQDRMLSLSDVIFYLKKNKRDFIEQGLTGFHYLNRPTLVEDALEVNGEMLNDFIELLIMSDFGCVVVDLSNRLDLMDAFSWHEKYMITTHVHHNETLRHYSERKELHLILNKIKENRVVDDVLKYASCIRWDPALEKGNGRWKSESIMHQLKKIIKDSLDKR